MDSMATTAATPKIIPSMVSSERSLWLARFSKPRARSGSHCARDLDAAREPVLIFEETALFYTRTRGRPGVARFGLFRCAGLRIDQRHDRARLNALEDGAAVAERADLDLLCLEAAVLLAVDDFLAPAVKDGFARNGDRVGQLITADTELGRETWAEPGVGLVKKNGDVKFVLGVIVPEFMGRRAADGFHFARETIARQRVDLDVHRLTGLEVAMIALSDLRVDLEMRNVDHLRDRAAGIHLVAHVIVGKCHAVKEPSPRRIAIAVNDYEAIDGRGDPHFLDVFFCLIHGQTRFVTFFLADRQRRFVGSAVGVDVLFELRQGSLGLVQR